MRTLVIDTALGACTAAACQADRVLSSRSQSMARGHAEHVAGFVRDVMSESGLDFDSLDRIGVSVGPGSFTGLRVGIAFALGLGQALGRPVVGLQTLQSLAWSVEGSGSGPVAAVIDARRGQVYFQAFLDGRPLDEPRAEDIEAAARSLFGIGRDWRWVGDGAHLIEADAKPIVTDPSASALSMLTQALDPAHHPARPLYLRAPDATPPTRRPGQARTS
jgi:tRNA threonylcarbamoyladenosine biosynthesis protein TsaB